MTTNSLGPILALMVIHVVCASGGYLMAKIALREFSPLAFGFWRFNVGLVSLLLLALVLKAWPRIKPSDWPRVIGLAILAVPLNQICFLVGMRSTSPSHASLLYGTTAVFALIFGATMGYERVRVLKVVAILLSLIGLCIVVLSSGNLNTHDASFRGDVWIFFGVLVWAAYTVFAKPIVKEYGAIPATVIILTIGSLMGLPILIPAAVAQDYTQVTWVGWVSVLYAGVIVTAVAYLIWFTLLRRIDPSQVAILSTPQPIVTALLSAYFLGEIIPLPLVIGGLLVIGGIVLMEAPALINRTMIAYQKTK